MTSVRTETYLPAAGRARPGRAWRRCPRPGRPSPGPRRRSCPARSPSRPPSTRSSPATHLPSGQFKGAYHHRRRRRRRQNHHHHHHHHRRVHVAAQQHTCRQDSLKVPIIIVVVVVVVKIIIIIIIIIIITTVFVVVIVIVIGLEGGPAFLMSLPCLRSQGCHIFQSALLLFCPKIGCCFFVLPFIFSFGVFFGYEMISWSGISAACYLMALVLGNIAFRYDFFYFLMMIVDFFKHVFVTGFER